MSLSRLSALRLGTSAAVVLATVVHASVAAERTFAPVEPSPVDLAWAVRGGGAQSVQSARVLLAKKAATVICAQDRLSARPAILVAVQGAPGAAWYSGSPACGPLSQAQIPAAGASQPAAP